MALLPQSPGACPDTAAGRRRGRHLFGRRRGRHLFHHLLLLFAPRRPWSEEATYVVRARQAEPLRRCALCLFLHLRLPFSASTALLTLPQQHLVRHLVRCWGARLALPPLWGACDLVQAWCRWPLVESLVAAPNVACAHAAMSCTNVPLVHVI